MSLGGTFLNLFLLQSAFQNQSITNGGVLLNVNHCICSQILFLESKENRGKNEDRQSIGKSAIHTYLNLVTLCVPKTSCNLSRPHTLELGKSGVCNQWKITLFEFANKLAKVQST